MKAWRITLIINAFLGLILALVILWGEIYLPDVPQDELFNYDGWMSQVNEERIAEAGSYIARMKKTAGKSSHPKIIQTLSEGETTFQSLLVCHDLMAEAIANRFDEGIWKANLNKAQAKADSLLMGKSGTLPFAEYIRKTRETRLRGELVSLSLQNIHAGFIAQFDKRLKELGNMGGVGEIIFDDFSFHPKATSSSSWVKGVILFNTPRSMQVGQKVRMQVRISKRVQAEFFKSSAVDNDQTADSLLVGEIMIVKLIGDAFHITAFDEDEQGVTDDGYTQWEFDVTALETGIHELYVKAGVLYHVASLGNTRKFFPSYEKKIRVEISSWKLVAGFVSNSWEFLVSTILIPGAIWGMGLRESSAETKTST
jgi:hypothetical protein